MASRGPGKKPFLKQAARRFRAATSADVSPSVFSSAGGCVQIRVSVTPNRIQLFAELDELASTAVTMVDEDDFWPGQRFDSTVYRQPLVFTDTEELAQLIASIALDEDPWIPWPSALPTFRQPIYDTDEDHAGALGGLRVDENYDVPNLYVPVSFSAPWYRQPPPQDHDERVFVHGAAGPGGGIHLIVRPPVRAPFVWTDTDVLASVAAPTMVDEDDGATFASRQPAWNRQPVGDLDDEAGAELGGLRIDEDYVVHGRFHVEQTRQPVSDQDELWFVASTISIDEEIWTQPYQQRLPSSSLVIRDTEEDHAGLLGGLRVDEDYVIHGRFQLDPNRQPVSDQDELWFVASTISIDEEIWTQPYQQRLPSSSLVIRDTEEDHAGTLGGFRLDEELAIDGRIVQATAFRHPWLVPDEWFVQIADEMVHRVWQPAWVWITPPVGTTQDELAVQPGAAGPLRVVRMTELSATTPGYRPMATTTPRCTPMATTASGCTQMTTTAGARLLGLAPRAAVTGDQDV